MENANNPEYLEKIKNQLVENLRRTAHAPSVQMQDVPRHSMGALSDEEDAELDDLDEDENKDVRMTQRRWEQRIERDNEYEESDNEDLDRANGVHRNGSTRPSFLDYRNSDAEANSGAAIPANGIVDNVVKSKELDDVVMEDVDRDLDPETEPRDVSSKPDEKETEQVNATSVPEPKETPAEAQDAPNSTEDSPKSEKPAAENGVETDKVEATKETDEAMNDDDEAKEKQPVETAKEPSVAPEAKSPPEPEKVDQDGDIDMDMPTSTEPAKEDGAEVKKEEAAAEKAASALPSAAAASPLNTVDL